MAKVVKALARVRVIFTGIRPRPNVPIRKSVHYKEHINGRSQDRIVTIFNGSIGKSRDLIGVQRISLIIVLNQRLRSLTMDLLNLF